MVRWIAGMLVGLALVAAGPDARARELSLGLITPPGHVWSQAARAFADRLARETDGRLRVAVTDSGARGNEAALLRQLEDGELDLALITVGELSRQAPALAALLAPRLAPDIESAKRILEGPTAAGLLRDMARHTPLVGLCYGMGGMRQMVLSGDGTLSEVLDEGKVRVTPVPAIADFYRTLGAEPVAVPLPAVDRALEQGEIDAVDMDLEMILALRLANSHGRVLITRHMMFPMVAVVSRQTWATLSAADRDRVRRILCDELGKLRLAYLNRERQWLEILQGMGARVEVVAPADLAEAARAWRLAHPNLIPVIERLSRDAGR